MSQSAGFTFFGSVRRNSVALMSLLIAIVALTQNSWRAERTEENRNIRYAAFEVLREATELQLLVDHAHYDADSGEGNPIVGWAMVQYMVDLSIVLPPEIGAESANLKQVWQAHFSALGAANSDNSLQANETITAAIQSLRQVVKKIIISLE
ncbi:hypothetical protein ACFVYJ_07700 [Pontibacter sp. JAM-7]|uniref:hypothetical protein n=1 Tax=Pontibacter sp. JAM-7 TaxID=3366581 RepID=UPI003AF91629